MSAFIILFLYALIFTNSHLKVMEEDKKKEVLGNGLATESEPTAVVKVFCNFECSGVKIKLSCIPNGSRAIDWRFKLLILNFVFHQPASSENGSAVKKLGALVDYNDSDSDEGKTIL